MVAPIQFNRDKFYEVFKDHLVAVQNMGEVMEAIGDPRDVCVIEIMKTIEAQLNDLFEAVETGKKMLWHEFLFFPEIFRGFPDVYPFFAELLCGFLPMFDPEGLNPYVDAAENMGLPPDICPADKGFLGAVVEEVQPPVDMVVAPTSPCDSAITAYQILQQLISAPVLQCDVPYWQDERGVDLYEHHIWKMIRMVEEVCKTKMDWDRCKEAVMLANDAIESFIAENEMRKLSPCPHPGKLGFYQFLTICAVSGTERGRDLCRFILEDSKKLAAEGKGALEEEKARILMYNPDPFYDLGVHDWMEDEFGAITVMSFFGHATQTMIDPSTPESIVRDYAWKMMNICMARQYRGPYEFFMDDFITVLEGWNVDAVIVPALIQCKHGQATHGFIREACRERDKPLLLVEFDPMDARPVSIDKIHSTIEEWMETQVIV
jgi:benzoyl-CoA reductase/2-hydroxyglutaryl-CoA dehydratase subunit BcrC/BadD/HgdB